MADYNRNQQSSYKGSNQDWNENRGRNRDEDDRNFGSSENRGMGNSNYENSGWQSRYERDDNNRGGGYSTGRYGRHFDSDLQSGSYGNDRGYGYASYYGSDANSGWERMGSTNQNSQGGSYGSGSYGGGMGSSSYGNSGNRGLYDRDYQGMGRSEYANSGTRLGGGNYGSWGDQNRGYYEGRNDRNSGNRSSGQHDRNWFDRAGDEVASWFGDEDAERRRDRDKRMQGQHRGKGPKNYNRSDDRIKEDINDRLSDDPFVDASEIDVTVSNGEVTLTGTVDERSSKRRAEDIAENVSGVKNVENRIRVSTSSSSTYGTSPSTGSPSTSSGASDSSTTSQSTSGAAGSERTRNKSYVTG